MAVPTYHPDFLISLLSITFLCVPEETGLQIRRRRHCGNVCNRFAFGCCGKVCLWGVGNLFSMPHEHTFPWQPNRLCTFPRCSPRDASPGATSSTSLSSDSHGKGGGGAWDFFPCAVPALAMAVPTHISFRLSYFSAINSLFCVPEETGLQIRRRRHCGNVCNRFAFGCCGKVCLWDVGNLFSMPHKHTFPRQPNRLCTFPRCPLPQRQPQVLQVAPPSEIQKDCRFTIFFVKRQPSSNCLFNLNPSL